MGSVFVGLESEARRIELDAEVDDRRFFGACHDGEEVPARYEVERVLGRDTFAVLRPRVDIVRVDGALGRVFDAREQGIDTDRCTSGEKVRRFTGVERKRCVRKLGIDFLELVDRS